MKKTIIASAIGAALLISGQSAMADEIGQKVYKTTCFACHMTGAAGAPKVGDTAAWAPRIAQGIDTLTEHAINGFKGSTGFMPPRGGRGNLSDEEVKGAIEYMVSQSQ